MEYGNSEFVAKNAGVSKNAEITKNVTTENPENRIILIDKPAGITSFGAVARVRTELKNEFGRKIKVGHTGTLDPFATGLLILLSGKFTKKSGEFLKLDKVYEATIRLGFTSTTGDPEGEIRPYLIEDHLRPTGSKEATEPRNARPLGRELPKANGREGAGLKLSKVESVLQKFTGTIEQTPPKFSAIKINGERAYKLARKNQTFEIPRRKVTIYNIEILDYNYPDLKIRCHVSSGTYIRSLAEDIGAALGVGAYCTALRRTKIGDYDVKDARKLNS